MLGKGFAGAPCLIKAAQWVQHCLEMAEGVEWWGDGSGSMWLEGGQALPSL